MIDNSVEDRELVAKWVLESPEAMRVKDTLPSTEAVLELCDTDDGLRQKLAETGVSKFDVARELIRNEWLRATLDEVSRNVEAPKRAELQQFYARHTERWLVPERRKLSHILITVQSQYAENTESAALLRINDVRTAIGAGAPFEAMARRVSECPTALTGGELGFISRGQLFPELDAAAFELRVMELSRPVRTEMGYHLVWCQEIVAERYQSFDEVEAALSESLAKRRRTAVQKQWVARVSEARRHAS